jgi:uncharacterized protein Yka (UPF0111/DUF47 family)
VHAITSLAEVMVLIEEVETIIEFHKNTLELLDSLSEDNSDFIEEINRRIRRLERYSDQLYTHKRKLMEIELALIKTYLETAGSRFRCIR